MSSSRSRTRLLTLATTLLLSPAVQAAEPDFTSLASELARLRTDVEALYQAIQDERDETRLKLRNISSQKTNLEAESQRDELRVKQLRQSLEEVQARIRDAGALQRELKPGVMAAIDVLRPPITQGLPFRTSDRLGELEALSEQLGQDTIAPANAVTRLWTLVEDELRLTRETGMYQQTIEVAGEQVLADVARVGMVMLYFRTPDRKFGYARRDGSNWKWELLTSSVDQQLAAAFFETLEKRIRVGFFDLPGAALPPEALR